jgi:hypothetical protein
MIIISYKDKVKYLRGQVLKNEDESAQPMVKLLADPSGAHAIAPTYSEDAA